MEGEGRETAFELLHAFEKESRGEGNNPEEGGDHRWDDGEGIGGGGEGIIDTQTA